MQARTDLALEKIEGSTENISGVSVDKDSNKHYCLTKIVIEDAEASNRVGKPKGTYITIEIPSLVDHSESEEAECAVAKSLRELLPEDCSTVLVVGIGNISVTPDALGPKTASRVLATRHIRSSLADEIGLKGIRSVAVLSPGVLGQTGIETAEIIRGTVARIQPSAIIVIDALASLSLSRLGCTVQLSDTGINPGSGVGNRRNEISNKSLGIPVVSVGVPTVVDAATIVGDITGKQRGEIADYTDMMVTPREIDLTIDRAATLLSSAINIALQPEIDRDILRNLV